MMLTFSKDKGFTINAGDYTAQNGKLVVHTSAGIYSHEDMKVCMQENIILFTNNFFNLTITINKNSFFIELFNTSLNSLSVEKILFDFTPQSFASPRIAREHLHIVHSREFAIASGVKQVHLPTEAIETNSQSGMVTVYSHIHTKQALLIGAIPPFGSGFTMFSTLHNALHMDDCFGIRINFDFKQELKSGGSLKTSHMVILNGCDGNKLLEQYQKCLKDNLEIKKHDVVIGWNSWDYYGGSVQRKDIDENMLACKDLLPNAIEYIVIDAGWECQWGIWEPNWKFPDGLEDFCSRVKKNGFKAGIWVAPLMVYYYTPLYRENPDWFVGDKNGNVFLCDKFFYGTMAQLDITHPSVEEHLFKVFKKLKSYGFEYFKCDFTQLILGADSFYDPTIGRADILRKTFQTIRQAIGDNCYLSSCGAPYEAVTGIVDSFRTSSDIHNYWSHILQSSKATLTRLWMQNAIGNIDPDFLIVRCMETFSDSLSKGRCPVTPFGRGRHWKDGKYMNLEETKVWAMMVYMSGGDIVLGDAISKLNQTGIKMIKKLLKPLPEPAKYINLFDQDGSQAPILLAETDTECIIAFFNFTDIPIDRKLQLAFLKESKQAVDFWTEQTITLKNDDSMRLPPRSVKAFRVPV